MLERTVKVRETVCRLPESKRELTDGLCVFRFYPMGRTAMGSKSRVAKVAELNQNLAFAQGKGNAA
jgi:hypothetical protein